MTRLLLILLAVTDVFASSWTFQCRHDEKIDPNIRQIIMSKNLKLIDSMQRSDPGVLMSMLIEEARQKSDCRQEVVKAYSRFKPLVESREFKVYTQCHIVSEGSEKYQFNIPSNTQEKFIIQAQRISRETYVCFLVSQNYFFDYMISIVYSKIADDWQVQRIHIGLGRIAGKSSYGWYQQAKEVYEVGNSALAYLDLEIARLLLRPSPFIQYPVEKEIVDVFDKFTALVHGKIYVRFTHLPTRPKLYNFSAQFIKTQMVPRITYITSLSLDNEQGLKDEARQMSAAIEVLFPGLEADSNCVAFQAYTEVPADPNKSYPSKNFHIDTHPSPQTPSPSQKINVANTKPSVIKHS